MRQRLTYDVMTEVQKTNLRETLEDMLEELDLAQCELGAGMTYGLCVFPYISVQTRSRHEGRA